MPGADSRPGQFLPLGSAPEESRAQGSLAQAPFVPVQGGRVAGSVVDKWAIVLGSTVASLTCTTAPVSTAAPRTHQHLIAGINHRYRPQIRQTLLGCSDPRLHRSSYVIID